MRARLKVAGGTDPHAELLSLRDWLNREPDFRGRVDVEEPVVRPGEMGGLAEVLTVALAGGGTLSVLAGSVSVWLEQRRSDITIEVVAPDGGSTKISARGRAADTVAKNLDPDRDGATGS